MKKIFPLLFLLSMPFALAAQKFEMNVNCKTAYDLVLQGRMEKAAVLLAYERKNNAENLCPEFLDNYVEFVSFLITEDKTFVESMEANKSKRVSKLEGLSDADPYKRWSIAVLNLQMAFLKVKAGQQYEAAIDVRRSLLLLERNKKRFSDFLQNELPLGILHATVGTIPPEYKWVLKIVSVEGSVAQGREELRHFLACSSRFDNLRYLHNEALYYLSFLETSFSDSKEERAWTLSQFRQSYLNYPILVESKANLEAKLGLMDESLKTIKGFAQNDCLYYCRLDYLKADLLLKKCDFSAEDAYRKFLKMNRGGDYKADALRKLAWIACLRDDENEYRRLMKKVSEMNCSVNEIDCEAIREARAGVMPNKSLLKARLFFDGFLFEKALQSLELASADSLSEKESLEVIYRKARVYHEMGLEQKAVECYRKTISAGESLRNYYAANAALKLGELYLSRGDTVEAKTKLHLCLEMNPDEYKNGIHQKANAILNQIR
jgi:hypothetical protein